MTAQRAVSSAAACIIHNDMYTVTCTQIRAVQRITDYCRFRQFVSFPSFLNHLMGTLKPQSNGPLYSNMVIGTLAVDECYIWYSEEGTGWGRSLLFTIPNVTAHCTNLLLFDVVL